MRFSTLFFDLDDTLYPSDNGMWHAIAGRIDRYMNERLGIPLEGLPNLRHELFTHYGTTLRGLSMTRGIDIQDYLSFVHDIPIPQFLSPDPTLRPAILACPSRRMILTNADRAHAGRVLGALDLRDCFEDVVDILDLWPYCKPMPEAYRVAMRRAAESDPSRCLLVDDSRRNLAGARAVGFFTVLIGTGPCGPDCDAQIDTLLHLPAMLKELPE
jgi:putative hydrolase of the HAD superfamily